ncbi:sigma-70 family RNA polymerase sigma factor [Cytobacillus praedii]|uniref:Sigma-70 family RNA polymerase sigma factor n=1 Tax=Cytobacillus praedii TaxID=1742358 RepID=A0A4R1AMU6_9BACI|nr:sigma-70 family RNA polymerase sigma factor [Cytobacillus praedii]TCJ01058.1 sigma-70 family RNA polymerase sigma factor [Cytobacillus praedii]
MSPEELFEQYKHLPTRTVYRLYRNNPKMVADIHRIEVSDLIQYANTGYWIACKTYDETRNVKFQSFAISNIRWHLNKQLVKDCHFKRTKYDDDKVLVDILSMEQHTSKEKNRDYHDVIGSNINVEEKVFGQIAHEFITSQLTNTQKEIIKLRNIGMTFNEIGEMIGIKGKKAFDLIVKARKQVEYIREVESV